MIIFVLVLIYVLRQAIIFEINQKDKMTKTKLTKQQNENHRRFLKADKKRNSWFKLKRIFYLTSWWQTVAEDFGLMEKP